MKREKFAQKENFNMEEKGILLGGSACEECTTNCLLNHVKERNPYCFVNRFFKVMLGDDFADVLFLPPRFARTVSEFVNQETYLEDSLGQRHNVKFSVVDDSLAFRDGWREFSVEHGLEEGDFLVFNHIRHTKRSYFIVHILGKSGCEKLNFPQENGGRRKRSRIDATISEPDKGCGRQDKNFIAKQCSSSVESKARLQSSESQLIANSSSKNYINSEKVQQVPSVTNNPSKNLHNSEKLQLVPSVIDLEEPLYMLNRDNGQNRDEGIRLYDLSSFEMQGNVSAIDESDRCVNGGEGTTINAEKCMKSQEESGLIGIPLQKEISSSKRPPSRAEIIRTNNIEESGAIKKFPVSHPSLCPGISSKTAAANENPSSKAGAIAKQKYNKAIPFSDSPASAPVFKNPFENKSTTRRENIRSSFATNGSGKLVKHEPVNIENMSTSRWENFQSSFATNGNDKIMKGEPVNLNKSTTRWENFWSSFPTNGNDKIVKDEPVDSLDISTSSAAAGSSEVVVDDQPFQLLMSSLPSVSFGGRWRAIYVIYLRAADGWIWPVLYHERNGLKVLTGGWQFVKTKYQIKPGDTCLIRIENEYERIYRIDVIHK